MAYPDVPIVVSEHLYKTIPGPSGRWARFRRWLEDRYRRVGLPYVWPLVQRDRIEPLAVQVGGVLYVHPRAYDFMRRSASRLEVKGA